MNTSRGLLMLIGISSGTGLVLINILLIACCLHKRHKKNLKGGKKLTEVKKGGIVMQSSVLCALDCWKNDLINLSELAFAGYFIHLTFDMVFHSINILFSFDFSFFSMISFTSVWLQRHGSCSQRAEGRRSAAQATRVWHRFNWAWTFNCEHSTCCMVHHPQTN